MVEIYGMKKIVSNIIIFKIVISMFSRPKVCAIEPYGGIMKGTLKKFILLLLMVSSSIVLVWPFVIFLSKLCQSRLSSLESLRGAQHIQNVCNNTHNDLLIFPINIHFFFFALKTTKIVCSFVVRWILEET